jgi:Putative addiction module component
MTIEEAISCILELSRSERLRVAQVIIESVASEDDPPLTVAEKRHIDEVLTAEKINPGRRRTWEEVEAEMIVRERRADE